MQDSPFIQQCLALARWVGDGTPVTATGVLRLAPAREAYLELGLWDRELRSREHRQYSAALKSELSPGESDALRDAALAALRSAADAPPLDRLWRACQMTRLIEVGRTKATATAGADPRHTRTDEEWLPLGVSAITSVVLDIEWPAIDPLLRVLLPFLRREVDRVTEDEVRQWWWTHPANYLAGLPPEDEPRVRPISDQQVRGLLWQLEDTDVWRREGETLHRTALGTEVAATLMGLMEEGLLMP